MEPSHLPASCLKMLMCIDWHFKILVCQGQHLPGYVAHPSVRTILGHAPKGEGCNCQRMSVDQGSLCRLRR